MFLHVNYGKQEIPQTLPTSTNHLITDGLNSMFPYSKFDYSIGGNNPWTLALLVRLLTVFHHYHFSIINKAILYSTWYQHKSTQFSTTQLRTSLIK